MLLRSSLGRDRLCPVVKGAGFPDLTGQWTVTHDVTASERHDFVGLSIEFQVTLLQSGDQLAGAGRKFLVAQHPADPEEGSQLEITGWVRGSRVQLALMEVPVSGDRINCGSIDWAVINPHLMTGTFNVDLARTSGRSNARRIV